MATCYGQCDNASANWKEKLNKIIPVTHLSQFGTKLTLDYYRNDKDIEDGMDMLNNEIEEGISWPFINKLTRE